MARDLYYGEQARQMLQAGIDQVANAVKVTLGPKGRNVLVDRSSGMALLTNNGASVTREIELEDIAEDLGAQMLKEVAKKTQESAGDGTTTAILLSQSIIREGVKNVAAGADPIALRRGIQGAVDVAVQHIDAHARKTVSKEDIAHIAVASGADRSVGAMIQQIMDEIGKDGVITVEESQTVDTSFRIVKGTRFDKGYLSSYMVSNQEKMEEVLERPYLLFTDKKITELQEVIPILDQVAQRKRPLLIVAEDVQGEALKALIINKVKGAINVIAVRAPGFGERKKALVDDIALVTGATVVREETGYDLSRATIDMLGQAEKVTVGKDFTLIVGGAGNQAEIEERMAFLHRMLDKAQDEFAVDRARERLGKLAGGVALIAVGAASELELKERKARIEDALNAIRAAMTEGITAGGGVAFCDAIPDVEAYRDTLDGDERTGAQIVRCALEAPAQQIAANAGYDGKVVVAKILSCGKGIGFDVETGTYVNMLEAGIIDPVKVTKLAIQNAASMAAVFLTTEADSIDPIDEAWLRAGGKRRKNK